MQVTRALRIVVQAVQSFPAFTSQRHAIQSETKSPSHHPNIMVSSKIKNQKLIAMSIKIPPTPVLYTDFPWGHSRYVGAPPLLDRSLHSATPFSLLGRLPIMTILSARLATLLVELGLPSLAASDQDIGSITRLTLPSTLTPIGIISPAPKATAPTIKAN
jgi:hypothetical protein